LAVVCLTGCWLPGAPPPDRIAPGPLARRIVQERASAVMVVARESIQDWADQRFPKRHASEDVDGGSAAPVAPDGYFLTADHVLARMNHGRHAFVLYGLGHELVTARARVVWRSAAADLALVHAPLATPHFYQWTPPGHWLPEGTWVIHGGIATGRESAPGRLTSSLEPEGRFTRARRFRLDVPLKPGDSGGPVVDARGLLVGINSAVEFLVPMDTALFVDSEGSRPNVRMIESLILKDRARKNR
jgi:S1-C subfamily serine protease